VLQVRDVPAECDSRPVCCHIQRVHQLAVKILDVALLLRGRLLGMSALRFDQMPRAGEVVGDLRQMFVGWSLPWPVSGVDAAADRVPDRAQPLHWIQFRRAVRRRRQYGPEFGG
jgi:hypothetical protein